MARILLVEDKEIIQTQLKSELEKILGTGTVDIVADYQTALEYLETNDYDLYIVDGSFPESPESTETKTLGPKLIEKIREKEGDYEKVRHISFETANFEALQQKGIKCYAKGGAEGYKDMFDIIEEIRAEFAPHS